MTEQFLIAAAATMTAFAVLLGGVVSVYRIAKRVDQALGLDKEGRTVSERLERVEHQLWENGGSSLADRVNNIEKHVVKVSTEIEFIKDLTLGLHQAHPDTQPIVKPVVKKPRAPRKKAS